MFPAGKKRGLPALSVNVPDEGILGELKLQLLAAGVLELTAIVN
jgi:hypothetical protein